MCRKKIVDFDTKVDENEILTEVAKKAQLTEMRKQMAMNKETFFCSELVVAAH